MNDKSPQVPLFKRGWNESGSPLLGMVLKGYPRISEAFISTEILLLERSGIPIEIYSLKQPREDFTHRNVKEIRAPVFYMPEYVFPDWRPLWDSNKRLHRVLGGHYRRCLARAVARAVRRNKWATFRHFLQGGHLAWHCLIGRPVQHLHAHFAHTPTSVTLFASELTGIPFSFTGHAKDIYTSEPEQIRRKIRLARFAVTCTQYNARYLNSLANGATPVHTVYHGIDLDLFSFGPSPVPSPPYRILSVGRPVPKKGYDDLLRALAILRKDGLDFQFEHIGSGDYEETMKRLTGELGLTGRVRMLGTLPHHEVIEHYRRAHCFALACKVADDGDRDGIPNVLVESMAVGLPVVSTRVSAIPELVEEGVTGTLVDPEQPEAMAAAIREVLEHPERSRSLLANARAKVEQEFDNQRNTRKLSELFRQTLRLST